MTARIESTMSADDLAGWKHRHGYSLSRGADELGIARRSLQNYLAGHTAIPMTIANLCWFMDRVAELQGGRIRWSDFEVPPPERRDRESRVAR